ncbi:hypothetical protein [Desulfovibrio sp. TomC]|uniref:hypothetical protein n=1 Tax=Desulfovibrio sp. TomC TaxID=1562888 RepID=UPI000573554C|nr:hypothetical protein [Desulfovibrio sp. TomC]KHK04426.1 hypothetical protein NY78_0204 [Desulfovibrio sp. TomC]
MRVWILAVVLILTAATGLAAETVSLTGRVTGVMQYPQKETICLSFETKDKKHYLICDDATAKDIIEKLFALGKKDADCRVDGTVAQKSGDEVRLAITGVGQGG